MVIDHLVFSNKHFNTEESKGQVGSIETEADALEACCDLHDTGPSKVVITSLDIDDKIMIIGSHVQSKASPHILYPFHQLTFLFWSDTIEELSYIILPEWADLQNALL
jgi:hypothetical protein